MRTYKEVVRKGTYTVLDFIKCDLCGKKATNEDCWKGGGVCCVDSTEICITIKKEEGLKTPSGSHGNTYNIDICPDCFKKKLVPWFKSQGADIKEENWDWY